jgi:hypothetical protein
MVEPSVADFRTRFATFSKVTAALYSPSIHSPFLLKTRRLREVIGKPRPNNGFRKQNPALATAGQPTQMIHVSEKKLAANRVNAKLSRGPKTPEGKARSAQNAVRHGLLAAISKLSVESRQGYSDRVQGYYDQFRPKTSSNSAWSRKWRSHAGTSPRLRHRKPDAPRRSGRLRQGAPAPH